MGRRNNDDSYYRYVDTSANSTSDTKSRVIDNRILFNRIKAVIVLAIIALFFYFIIDKIIDSSQAKNAIKFKDNLTVEFLAKRKLSDFIDNI